MRTFKLLHDSGTNVGTRRFWGWSRQSIKKPGKQELYLKQRPEELEKLVEIAKVQSTEASNCH